MSQPSKRRIPKSRAKTAYGLLTEIENVIDREPKRIAMGVVLLRGKGIDRYNSQEYRSYETPACGTIGCVAGWAQALTTDTGDYVYMAGFHDTMDAQITLGLTNEQGRELFFPEHLLHDSHPQTRQHANATIKHIRAFKAKYSRQLRAHKLESVNV